MTLLARIRAAIVGPDLYRERMVRLAEDNQASTQYPVADGEPVDPIALVQRRMRLDIGPGSRAWCAADVDALYAAEQGEGPLP